MDFKLITADIIVASVISELLTFWNVCLHKSECIKRSGNSKPAHQKIWGWVGEGKTIHIFCK